MINCKGIFSDEKMPKGGYQVRLEEDWYSVTRVSKKFFSLPRSMVSLIQGKGFFEPEIAGAGRCARDGGWRCTGHIRGTSGAVRPKIPRGRQSSAYATSSSTACLISSTICCLNSGVQSSGFSSLIPLIEIDSEIEMDRLIAQDVLELLANSGHFVLSVEGEDHHKTAIEKDSFHDDVVTDEVLEEFLRPFQVSVEKPSCMISAVSLISKASFSVDCRGLRCTC